MDQRKGNVGRESREGSGRAVLRGASRTHVGLSRSNNQDFLSINILDDGSLLAVVADGMGGHSGGEVASRVATETFVREIISRSKAKNDGERLTQSLRTANNAVIDQASRDSNLKGMGTTLVATLMRPDGGTVINLGDSRAYLWSGRSLQQITDDHSFVGELVRDGMITPEEASVHPKRNVLTQALGTTSELRPDLFDITLDEGDLLLLCSDGMHGMADDQKIAEILQSDSNLEVLCDRLVEAALDGGGRDNVTVVLVGKGEQPSDYSGPDTAPGSALAGEPDDAGYEPRRKPVSERTLILGLLGLILLLFLLWMIFYSGWIGESGPDDETDSTQLDELYLDTTNQILDSSQQLTPGDMVNDSAWSDSLSLDTNELRRQRDSGLKPDLR